MKENCPRKEKQEKQINIIENKQNRHFKHVLNKTSMNIYATKEM